MSDLELGQPCLVPGTTPFENKEHATENALFDSWDLLDLQKVERNGCWVGKHLGAFLPATLFHESYFFRLEN